MNKSKFQIMKTFYLIFFFIVTSSQIIFSQSNFTIKINRNLNQKKIKLFYTDGPENKFVDAKFHNNTYTLVENFKSKYFRLVVMYPDKNENFQSAAFLVNEKKSSVKFNAVVSSISNKLSNYISENVIEISKCKEIVELNKYTKNELKEYKKISAAYNSSKTDTNTLLFNQSSTKLALKELEYIKKHGTEYFYFWTFTQSIVGTLKKEYLLELYEVFNTSFPEKFKNSYEGKSVKALLEGTLNVKIGMPCPSFNATDYLSKEISSEKLKDKFYLISFWATWCSPCIKEIPQLKRIRETYNQNKLDIISITRDTDSLKFIKGINEYKMNWTHVFNSPTMENLFGQKPIPSIYLIDRNGKIIFSSWEKNLSELDEILKKEIGE